MAKEIFMPKLSSTMAEGTVIEWFKDEGDTVETGEPILEIMTDKINIEVESYHDGVLLKKYYETDDVVPVNQVIGYIGDSGEDVPDTPPEQASGDTDDTEQNSDASSENTETDVRKDSKDDTGAENTQSRIGKVPATPSARALARNNDVDIKDVTGSGRNGRIHREDVAEYINSIKDEKQSPKTAETAAAGQPETVKTSKLKGAQKVTADRMLDSRNTIPHVTMDFEVSMGRLIELRKTLNDNTDDIKISFNDLFTAAVSAALKKHPDINITYQNNEIHHHESVNIGIAVASGSELFVPVIKNAGQRGLSSISEESKKIIRQIKDKNFTEGLMSDGTFTISNLGMYNIKQFTPIINKPQAAILGIGGMYDVVDLVDDKCVKVKKSTLSLSFDHRVINGAPAAAFCDTVKELVENPVKLLL
ncbi:dihydrolipoamide acetyltransferase family protein [Corticicoccus populi]|uniref:Dihydrolipoamide acetyltransferase component of pyruvate dehydrogenase complex n=1 Tax=Corticicoccus populi TaxID=1812821 RepID=A0ABW5WW21_9STAP